MRRLARRRLFTLCSAASLLLFVAVCVLWSRSELTMRSHDSVFPLAAGVWGDGEVFGFERIIAASGAVDWERVYWRSADGEARIGRSRRREVSPDGRRALAPVATGGWRWFRQPPPGFRLLEEPNGPRRDWECLGIGWYDKSRTFGDDSGAVSSTHADAAVVVPYWFLALSLSIPLLARVGHRLWQLLGSATRRGLCTRCGYDLRATPGRCPECGTSARETFPAAPPG